VDFKAPVFNCNKPKFLAICFACLVSVWYQFRTCFNRLRHNFNQYNTKKFCILPHSELVCGINYKPS
jgi:hypothetical protein